MKIQMLGDAVVIKSTLTMEQIAKTKKFNAKALTLFETDDTNHKEPVFCIGVGAQGGFNKNGIIFDTKADDGCAQVTLTAVNNGDTMEQKAAQFAEEFAMPISRANTLETLVLAAYAGIEAATASAQESIEVVG